MKPFVTWHVSDDEEYKLKLAGEQICSLEERFKGKNLMSVIGDAETGAPALRTMLLVIHSAMNKYHHGKKLSELYDIYDRYIENGGSQMDLYVDVYVPIFQVSGFFSKKQAEQVEAVTETVQE